MSDLRAAAERVRRVEAGERQRAVYGFDDDEMDDFDYRMLENAHTRDLTALAHAYLASHPPDGETEIDEAWLVSVGGDNNYDAGCVTFASEHGDTIAWLRSVSRVFVNGRGLHKPVITRSDLHRLCAALGIPLGEEE